MSIERVEKLGDVCAFRPKVIQVKADIYDKVPAEKMEDFESVLTCTRQAYEKAVADAKASGAKVSAAAFKAKAIEENLMPFIKNLGLEATKKEPAKKVVVSKEPRITDAKEPIQMVITPAQKDLAEQYYDNNFEDDMLSDSIEDEDDSDASDEVVSLGDDFDVEDDFDFEGL